MYTIEREGLNVLQIFNSLKTPQLLHFGLQYRYVFQMIKLILTKRCADWFWHGKIGSANINIMKEKVEFRQIFLNHNH